MCSFHAPRNAHQSSRVRPGSLGRRPDLRPDELLVGAYVPAGERGGHTDCNACNPRRRRDESPERAVRGKNPALGSSVVVTTETHIVGLLGLPGLTAALLVIS